MSPNNRAPGRKLNHAKQTISHVQILITHLCALVRVLVPSGVVFMAAYICYLSYLRWRGANGSDRDAVCTWRDGPRSVSLCVWGSPMGTDPKIACGETWSRDGNGLTSLFNLLACAHYGLEPRGAKHDR